jgi:hypothetical protein
VKTEVKVNVKDNAFGTEDWLGNRSSNVLLRFMDIVAASDDFIEEPRAVAAGEGYPCKL